MTEQDFLEKFSDIGYKFYETHGMIRDCKGKCPIIGVFTKLNPGYTADNLFAVEVGERMGIHSELGKSIVCGADYDMSPFRNKLLDAISYGCYKQERASEYGMD